MSATIKTIIFDFGNVVSFFDYGPAFAKLCAITHLSEGEIRSAIDTSGVPEAFETGHITAAQFLDQLIEICQIRPDCDRDLLAAAWSDIFVANPEVCDLIPRLKPRYRLMLGSNTNELHAGQFRRQFADVLGHFDQLVLSFEIKVMKPDHRFFRRCHELSGCEPRECVFIDDLAANINAARTRGLQGIVYQRGTDLNAELKKLGIHESCF